MIVICQHCRKLLAIKKPKSREKKKEESLEISHGDCSGYDKPCNKSKKYLADIKKQIELL